MGAGGRAAAFLPLLSQPLPPTLAEFSGLASKWFPGGLFDTKLLAKDKPGVFEGFTGLSEVFCTLFEQPGKERAEGMAGAEIPNVEHAPGFRRYAGVEGGSYAHEAGYDAFMTGAAFAGLLRLQEAAAT